MRVLLLSTHGLHVLYSCVTILPESCYRAFTSQCASAERLRWFFVGEKSNGIVADALPLHVHVHVHVLVQVPEYVCKCIV